MPGNVGACCPHLISPDNLQKLLLDYIYKKDESRGCCSLAAQYLVGNLT